MHLNTTRKAEIQSLFSQGQSYQDIARTFGISRQRVYQILRGIKHATFHALRDTILKRDRFQCQRGTHCTPAENTSEDDLVIQHIDGNPGNNAKDNLLTVCKRCHIRYKDADRERRVMTQSIDRLYKGATEVAAILGCSRIYVLLRTNKPRGIRATKISGRYLYAVVDILDFYQRYKPKTHAKPPLPKDLI